MRCLAQSSTRALLARAYRASPRQADGHLQAMAQLLHGTRHAEIDVASAIAALPTAMEWSPRTYPGRC